MSGTAGPTKSPHCDCYAGGRGLFVENLKNVRRSPNLATAGKEGERGEGDESECGGFGDGGDLVDGDAGAGGEVEVDVLGARGVGGFEEGVEAAGAEGRV